MRTQLKDKNNNSAIAEISPESTINSYIHICWQNVKKQHVTKRLKLKRVSQNPQRANINYTTVSATYKKHVKMTHFTIILV